MSADPGRERRRRVLYGRRRGRRLRTSQRELVERLLPGLEASADDMARPASLFPFEPDDIWCEIGFGGGEHLVWQASRNPTVGMIGCEPFVNGTARLLRAVSEEGIRNIRLFCDDARLMLQGLPGGSIGRVFLLYPDPWPKARHHKRRMVSDPVLAELARIMRGGSELRIATDDDGYLEWILEHMDRQRGFSETWRGTARPDDWPPTRYERKAVSAGRTSTFLRYARLHGSGR